MGFIGNNLKNVLTEAKSVDTMTGDGSTTTITLSKTPGSVNNTTVFWDGIFKTPITDYTLSGTTITFGTAPAQDVHVMVFSGNDSLVESPANVTVTSSMIADGSITSDKIATVDINKLDGTLPAGVDASALTGMPDLPSLYTTVSASDPTRASNPTGGVGTMWVNSTDGELFVCVDAGTDNNEWRNVGETQESDNIAEAPKWFGDRAMWMGGSGTAGYTASNALSYNNITTLGDATIFGDTVYGHGDGPAACSDASRALVGGGYHSHYTSPYIDYCTISTPGNAQNFGQLVPNASGWRWFDGTGNGTRGLFGPSLYGSNNHQIQYVTIQTTGNSQNFGDVYFDGGYYGWSALGSNGTRGIIAGGHAGKSKIGYVDIATTGNAQLFGELINGRYMHVMLSNRTYGVIWGGWNGSNQAQPNEYITIATSGNAVDFPGTSALWGLGGCGHAGNNSRGLIKETFGDGWGGAPANGGSQRIEYMSINTPSQNAQIFGNLTSGRSTLTGCSGDAA